MPLRPSASNLLVDVHNFVAPFANLLRLQNFNLYDVLISVKQNKNKNNCQNMSHGNVGVPPKTPQPALCK